MVVWYGIAFLLVRRRQQQLILTFCFSTFRSERRRRRRKSFALLNSPLFHFFLRTSRSTALGALTIRQRRRKKSVRFLTTWFSLSWDLELREIWKQGGRGEEEEKVLFLFGFNQPTQPPWTSSSSPPPRPPLPFAACCYCRHLEHIQWRLVRK